MPSSSVPILPPPEESELDSLPYVIMGSVFGCWCCLLLVAAIRRRRRRDEERYRRNPMDRYKWQ